MAAIAIIVVIAAAFQISKSRTFQYFLSRTSRKTITWDVEPDSYPEIAADSNKIVAHTLEKTRPGSIILLHVMYKGRGESLKAVKGIITGLKGVGYSFKTVSEMLAVTD